MPCQKSGLCALYGVSLPGFTGVGPRRTNFSTFHNANRRCRRCRAKNQASAHYTVSHSPDSPASGPGVRFSVHFIVQTDDAGDAVQNIRAVRIKRGSLPGVVGIGPRRTISVHSVVQTHDAGNAVQQVRSVHIAWGTLLGVVGIGPRRTIFNKLRSANRARKKQRPRSDFRVSFLFLFFWGLVHANYFCVCPLCFYSVFGFNHHQATI